MEEKNKQLNILQQFFSDKNANFPRQPKLVNGIRVYEAPKGLGIQFRGGTEIFLVVFIFPLFQFLHFFLCIPSGNERNSTVVAHCQQG